MNAALIEAFEQLATFGAVAVDTLLFLARVGALLPRLDRDRGQDLVVKPPIAACQPAPQCLRGDTPPGRYSLAIPGINREEAIALRQAGRWHFLREGVVPQPQRRATRLRLRFDPRLGVEETIAVQRHEVVAAQVDLRGHQRRWQFFGHL